MAVGGFKGFGWILGLAIVSPACYMVSSMVAAERGRVESVERAILRAHHDIRILETEFQTRANLAQLERWNGEVLALSAPRPDQYIGSDRSLASLRPFGDRAVRYASLVVPSAPPEAIAPAGSPAGGAGTATAAVGSAALDAPAAVAVATKTVRSAVAHGRAQAVAMLDDKLISDSTLGDLMSTARAETARLR